MAVKHDGYVRDGIARINKALESYTKAGLPTPGNAGRLARVTDNVRGVWMDRGARWSKLGVATADVFDFSAAGDGVTDDTVAINDAGAAVEAAGGGTVFLPPPAVAYLVSQATPLALAIRLRSKVEFIGAGPASVIKLANGQPTFTRVFANVSGDGLNRFAVRNLRIDGNKANQTAGFEQQHAIMSIGGSRGWIEGVEIHDMRGDGVFLHSSAAHTHVERNVVHDIDRVAYNGQISDTCRFSGNVAYDIPNNWAFKLELDNPTDPQNLVFNDNVAKNVGGGVQIGGQLETLRVAISGCVFELSGGATAAEGIRLGQIQQAVISDVVIKNPGTSGDAGVTILTEASRISLRGVDVESSVAKPCFRIGGGVGVSPLSRISLVDCHAKGGNHGLQIQAAASLVTRRVQVLGCSFSEGSVDGAELSDCEDVRFVGTLFYNNTNYGAVLSTGSISPSTRVSFLGCDFVNPAAGVMSLAGILVGTNGVTDLSTIANTYENCGVPVKDTSKVLGLFENYGGISDVAHEAAGRMTLPGFIEGREMAVPAAPAANGFRLYAKDNGSGKTQLIARFATGAEQVISTEP